MQIYKRRSLRIRGDPFPFLVNSSRWDSDKPDIARIGLTIELNRPLFRSKYFKTKNIFLYIYHIFCITYFAKVLATKI